MAERIPQSVSYLVVFRAYLSSDGKTPATGKTIAITISKNGATSFSNPNAGALNATEMASGFYKFTLDTTDTGTLGPLAWRGSEATINDAGDVLQVVNPNNAGFAGIPNATPGANNGLMISGSNTGPWSVSGGVTFTNSNGSGLTCSSTGGSGDGLTLSGNLTGDGIHASGGSTGHGVHFIGGGTSGPGILVTSTATNEDGVVFSGSGTGSGLKLSCDTTGKGLLVAGGALGISVTTSSGDGISVTPTGGNALLLTANGTSKHGLISTGGTAGTSDGVKAVAGTGGVPIRGAITGDITGNLSGSVGSVTGSVTVGGYSTGQDPATLIGANLSIDGKTFQQAIEYMAASIAGKVSGAGSGTETFKGLDGSTTRLTITCDSVGNRTAITYG